MATAGVVNGTLIRLYVDQAGGSTYTVFGSSMDFTINVSHSPRETTNQGSAGFASFLEGLRSHTIDFNNLHAEDGGNNFWLSYATVASNTLRGRVTGKFTTAVTGDKSFTFTGYFTSLSMNSGGPEANATFNGSIQVDGVPVVATVSA